MYKDLYSEELTEKLAKLKKKNPEHYNAVNKKMQWILANPQKRFKDLHFNMKGLKRIHIGHFVLIFKIDNTNKIISFEDYDHHDKMYK